MYLYSFTQFAGFDRVFAVQIGNFSIGDVVKCGDDVFLVLGEQLAFQELYKTVYIPKSSFSVVYPRMLGEKTMYLFHRMVEEYYTSYKNVMKYFLSDDISILLQREISPAKKKSDQKLVVYPDLWTLMNMTTEAQRNDKQTLVLYGGMTQLQKDKARRQIKQGQMLRVFSTYGELFQDFRQLSEIQLIDPHKRYYANQQDPRFKVGDVLNKMAELRGISVKN